MDPVKLCRILIPLLLLSLMFACGKRADAALEDESSVYSEHLRDEIPPDELKRESQASQQGELLPLEKYNYTWTDGVGIPDIVIIVDDFGNSGGALLSDFAKLPSEVAFAILPDLPFTRQSGELAAQYGHEVLIHVPMQPVSTSEKPGKNYIRTDADANEISSLIADFSAQLPMAVAANNHMGSAVTADRNAMASVLRALHAQGLFFVDSATSAQSVGPALARNFGYPVLKRDIFLDVPDNSAATLAGKISSLEKFKGRREPIVIITHCHNRAKLDALQSFITQIQSMGLHLTTLSAAGKIAA